MTASTLGIHHVGLTVLDVSAACTFFVEALGFWQVGEKPDYPAVFVSDGTVMLTLWQARDPSTAAAFDRHRCVGLHHLALRVADDSVLTALHRRLAAYPGVAVEFAPEALGQSGTRHMMCTIVGGLRVEFIAPE